MTDELLIETTASATGSAPTDAHREMTSLWARILLEVARRRQDELPGLTETLQDQVLITSGGTTRRALGWFEACAWRHEDRLVHELFVNADFGQTLDPLATAEDILVTLLHEACHVWAHAEGIKDTSRDGRYHNRRFAEIALQIGLQIDRDAVVGHRTPGLSARGRSDYGDLLTELEGGLMLTREPRLTKPDMDNEDSDADGQPGARTETGASASTSKYVFACCGCRAGRGRMTIRVAKGSWRPGVIRCAACGNAFEES